MSGKGLGRGKIAQIVADFRANGNLDIVADKHDVHKETVRKHARAAKFVVNKPRKFDMRKIAASIELYDLGCSTHQIADIWRVSQPSVRKALARNGVVMRSKSEAVKLHYQMKITVPRKKNFKFEK